MAVSRVPGFEGVPELHADVIEHRRMLARAVNRLTEGKLNAAQDVTLRANEATTPVADPRLGATSVVLWMPRTATAATAAAAGIWISHRSKGTAVLNHPISTAVDQELTLLIIG